jgi:hypothetical protein
LSATCDCWPATSGSVQDTIIDELISTAVGICGHASRAGDTFTWECEWPRNSVKWQDPRVQLLLTRSLTATCVLPSFPGRKPNVSEDCPREHGAAGKPNVSVIPCQEAQCVGSAGELLRIETNHPRLPQALRPFVVTEAALEVDHAQSLSTDQVQGLATSVWQALLPSVGGTPSGHGGMSSMVALYTTLADPRRGVPLQWRPYNIVGCVGCGR